MSTQAQIDANRRNAQQSTGPRTPEGKSIAAMNSCQHGLRSADPVGPGEDPAVYRAFALELIAELNPIGMQQRLIAERLAQMHWKLQRIPAVEGATLQYGKVRLQEESSRRNLRPPLGITAAQLIACDMDTMLKLQNYELRLQRAIAQAMRELKQLQAEAAAEREAEEETPPAPASTETTTDITSNNHRPDTDLPPNWVRSAERDPASADVGPPSPCDVGKLIEETTT